MNDNILKHDYLTATEVSKYLNISLSKAYELTHRKDFPTCRFGGSIRIPREAFLSWVEQHTRIPTGLSVA
jgi:excisionase family DNA binding protein